MAVLKKNYTTMQCVSLLLLMLMLVVVTRATNPMHCITVFSEADVQDDHYCLDDLCCWIVDRPDGDEPIELGEDATHPWELDNEDWCWRQIGFAVTEANKYPPAWAGASKCPAPTQLIYPKLFKPQARENVGHRYRYKNGASFVQYWMNYLYYHLV
jgi:hypothetical protein